MYTLQRRLFLSLKQAERLSPINTELRFRRVITDHKSMCAFEKKYVHLKFTINILSEKIFLLIKEAKNSRRIQT